MSNKLNLIVTQGPYSTFLKEIILIEEISGIRLNTIMPIKEGKIEDKLRELRMVLSSKTLWIDLKTRQLRIKEFANTPYTAITISHKIKVNTPTLVYFDNGNITGKLVEVDGNKLILEDYVGRILGPGESVNIIDESLEYIDSSAMTELDLKYIDVCRNQGIKHFMLSFVESKKDIDLLRELYPECIIMSKVENKVGLENIDEISRNSDYVMAARGDLYIELDYPHQIIKALKKIYDVSKDKAFAASRMFSSLLNKPFPSCSEIMDIGFLKEMGYTNFLIGDDICFKREVLIRAINIFRSIFKE